VRVLHVLDSTRRRGAQVFAADLITALETAGLTQEVAVVHGNGASPTTFRVPVTSLVGGGWQTPGLRVDVNIVRDLRGRIRHWKPDLIQSHGGDSVKYTGIAAAGLGVPLVVRAIGTAPAKIRRGVGRFTYKRLYRNADAVVAVGETVRSEILSIFGVPPDRVRAISNAVDAARMRPRLPRDDVRSALRIPLDARVILSIGALTWEKDPLAHIRIAQRVAQRIPGVVHVIVGDGPLRADVEVAIERQDPLTNTRLLGSRDDIADLLAASDVLLFASRPDGMEGVPAVVIEAGMLGLPVVGYDVAGVHEVVVDGATGVLLPSGDANGVVDGIAAVFADDALQHRLGVAARGRCLRLFEIGAAADRYIDLYEDCLVERRRGVRPPTRTS
jgi:glycosyltransferase involved in cell wall biosynthesis